MWLSDTSVKRPVFATVINLMLVAFGILAFMQLPLREYPDIDPPIVSVDTTYQGAAANVVETRITQLIEDRIAGVEGIKTISSQSRDGRSSITVEFDVSRDIDDAANDIRDRVSGALDDIPPEADPPEIQKADADDDVIIWLNLQGEGMSIIELTDYARRYVEDRFSSLDGVARVRIGGARDIAMRVWVDRNKLAARGLTVEDIESALRKENVELPAGQIESRAKDFTVRMQRGYHKPEDFRQLVLSRGESGYLVRLGDVARVEIAAEEERGTLRGNGLPMVGIGVVKQSKANTLDVADAVKKEMERANSSLPDHMKLALSFDSSIFIDSAIKEVYFTLFITALLVVGVIYAFLGNFRATLVPAVAVPVSLIGTFMVLFALGFTINLLTLLALVLAIGLVVDDAIVVIENIYRRVELGEPRLIAAYRGTRQVGFAVIATTAVLVAVFVPITFLEGDLGRLFREFAVAMAAAVILSSVVALSFSPMLSSKLLSRTPKVNRFTQGMDARFERLRARYIDLLGKALERPAITLLTLGGVLLTVALLFTQINSEFAPQEDRGVFFMTLRGPEGASYDYTMEHLNQAEQRMMPFVESGEIQRLLMRAPGSFGATATFNDARGIIILSNWDTGRKPIDYYMAKSREVTADLSGVRVSATQRSAFGGGVRKPVQFVLGGPSYEELAKWRDTLLEKAAENKRLVELDHDYYETKPQIGIRVDRNRAGDLGVPVSVINSTLESMLGLRRVTTFIDRGEEYDVIIESEKDLKQSPLDISNIYVRSVRTQELIPLSNLVEISEFADAASLNRYNRVRSITLEAGLAEGYSLGEALEYLEELVRTELPAGASIDYKGDSLDFVESSGSVYFIFLMALVIVYLVMAGQFESFVHPLVIMISVPLAVVGALIGLWLFGLTLNIYSQIGLIILVGLATKNGILIVEFINQLRDEGMAFRDAIIEASSKRLRPIVMTNVTTIMGAVPLVLASGAGAESRLVIGVVIIFGLALAMLLTLFVIPVMYNLLCKRTVSPHATAVRLEAQLEEYRHQV
ncbi:MAG: efflux RND transporter permease subunit [Alphaproteobacteria bacterium]